MKRFVLIVLVMILLSTLNSVLADSAFEAALRARYAGSSWQIEEVSQCGDAGAALLRRGNSRKLCVSKSGMLWEAETVLIGNLPSESRYLKLYMDTDETLFLTYYTELDSYTYDFRYTNGHWLLTTAYSHSPYPVNEWESEPLLTHIAYISGSQIIQETLLEDENENILWSVQLPVLPNVLLEEERDLRYFSLDSLKFCPDGYSRSSVGSCSIDRNWLERIYAAMAEQGTQPLAQYTFADGIAPVTDWVSGKFTLQFLADRPDGKRVLLCGSAENGSWEFVESSPLPEGTVIGIDNFDSYLALGGEPHGPCVGRFSDGTWGVTGILDKDYMMLGRCWISEGNYWWDRTCIGDHPWSNITMIDWNALPHTLSEAQARLSTSRWATPNNPNPNDRLNLRASADKNSDSLGKFYNGTPVEVLERGDEWTRVRVCGVTGYMMTRYLAFGSAANRVTKSMPIEALRNAITTVRWLNGASEQIVTHDLQIVIGILTNEKKGDYIIWDPLFDRTGYVSQNALWEGNG
ncbi:MAG: SH3 domain-containing protein [Clostridia bacterium]|nr:SH3 domain-containing protein [Clostridia bacterium]